MNRAHCSICPGLKWGPMPQVDEDGVYWLGYLLTDPKQEATQYYDISIQDACNLNLINLPVIYNHEKNSRVLGRIHHAWHNHDFGHPFSIAFLAQIDSRDFLQSSANLSMLSEHFASLSTLKDDPSKAVEVSLCYCGARDKCVAMFAKGKRIAGLLPRFGYKRDRESESTMTLEETLPSLQDDAYATVKAELEMAQNNCQLMMDRLDDAHSTQDHLVNHLCNMVSSCLEMESESNSELARKRKADLEALRNRKDEDRSTTIKELLRLCAECYEDNSVSQRLAHQVLERFRTNFPDLKVNDNNNAGVLVTVDAAFNALGGELKRRDASLLDERNKMLSARAMELAKDQYGKINAMSTSAKAKTTTNMSFEDYMRARGVMDLNQQQKTAKRKREPEPESEEEEEVNCRIPKHKRKHFLSWMMEDYKRLQDRYMEEQDKSMNELGTNLKSLLEIMKQQQQQQPPEKSSADPQQVTVDASMSKKKQVLWDL